MGIAAIMIILCHAPAHVPNLPSILNATLPHFGIGVDLFLLLSGLGIYYSLERRNVCWSAWYKVRFLKLGVPYLVFAIPMYSYLALQSHLSVANLILHISTISYWTSGWGLWFVAMLVPVYLTAPFVYKVVRSRYSVPFVIVLVLLTFILANLPKLRVLNPFCNNIIFCYMRYPSFLLGMMSAHVILSGGSYRKSSHHLSLLSSLFIVLSLSIFLVWEGNQTVLSIYWILLIPVVFILIGSLRLITNKWLIYFNEFIGKISLESYCTNVFLTGELMSFLHFFPFPVSYLVASLFSIVISFILHSISSYILHLTSR